MSIMIDISSDLQEALSFLEEAIADKKKEIKSLAISGGNTFWQQKREHECQNLIDIANKIKLVNRAMAGPFKHYIRLDRDLRAASLADPSLKGHIVLISKYKKAPLDYCSRLYLPVPINTYRL